MSLPSAYMQWCRRHGINGYHPDAWTEEEHAQFREYKRLHFIWTMQVFKAFDQPKLMTRATLLFRIREYLDRLHEPPPSRPYKTCPCHRFTPRQAERDTAPHGFAWMAQTFGRKS